jgi:hypothetical protein
MRDNLEHGWIVNDKSDDDGEAIYVCEWCGESIYEGEKYYNFDGEKVCADCVSGCAKFA